MQGRGKGETDRGRRHAGNRQVSHFQSTEHIEHIEVTQLDCSQNIKQASETISHSLKDMVISTKLGLIGEF